VSTYEFYEFVAVDRPLSEQQCGELRSLSTRARITSTSFVNEYHWGSFRGDPRTMVERYFDVHLYLASWGTRELLFKLPRALLGLTVAQQYCGGDDVSCWAEGDNVIISLLSSDEDSDWDEEAEGRLSAIAGVRAELATGDQRPLYLAWLLSVQSGEIDAEEIEPAVPPNLGDLTAAQRAFADFLRLDDALLAVAAGTSPRKVHNAPADTELTEWIEGLPATDKNALLLQAVRGGGAQVQTLLQARFNHDRRPHTVQAGRRTAGELHNAAEDQHEARQRADDERAAQEQARREQVAAAAREQRLEALALEGERAWERVEAHIAAKKAADYDLAVKLLRDLQEIADRKDASELFDDRVGELRVLHQRKPALVERLLRADLLR
jgi:hypothetical protein